MKPNYSTYNAACTVFWFLSGDQIMHTSYKTNLVSLVYHWWMRNYDRNSGQWI